MNKLFWSSKEKFKIVVARGDCRKGIRDEANLAEVCNHHQITQSQFYPWRDKLLSESDMPQLV